ncbi:MAG: TIGR03067 domain-containing protein [Gemmataceae bacterium]
MKKILAVLLILGIGVMSRETLPRSLGQEGDKKEAKKEEKKESKLSPAQVDALKELSGNFVLVSFERDGKKSSPEELKKMKIVQNGSDWSFHLGDDITTGKDTPFPDKNPKEVDSLYDNGPAKGKSVKGIYKVEGDTITYCWAEPEKDRPKEFATKADSGHTLMVLKKVKDEKPAEKKAEAKEEKKDEKKD